MFAQKRIASYSTLQIIACILILASLTITGCTQNQEAEMKKTLKDFNIRASNLFFYYKDLDRATEFYTETLGIEMVADYGFAKILRVAETAYLILVDAEKGMHTADEPKTVAIALVTDQLEEWYDYMVAQGVEMRHEFKYKEGKPHDGFVALDPEGYLLEFERFNPHPENEKFTPILAECKTLLPSKAQKTTVPKGLGFKAMVTWLYYKDLEGMMKFYEDVLGLEMIVDQGWTKIYQVSATGFIGLVDEKRGMHSFTEEKGVTVSFIIDDLEDWYKYAKAQQPFELRSEKLEIGDENKYRAFVGYDPEGYFMEFDKFYEHSMNEKLMAYLYKK